MWMANRYMKKSGSNQTTRKFKSKPTEYQFTLIDLGCTSGQRQVISGGEGCCEEKIDLLSTTDGNVIAQTDMETNMKLPQKKTGNHLIQQSQFRHISKGNKKKILKICVCASVFTQHYLQEPPQSTSE